MNQTALITGASSGIGLDLARLFARDGHDLVLVARSEGKLQELADELHAQHGIAAHVVPEDLSDPASPQRLFDATGERDLSIDFLVNNAGFGLTGRFAELDLERQIEMVRVNVTSLTHLTRLFLPGMLERGRGRVLNLASTAAFQPGPLMAVYYATKAFVLSFSEAIAEEVSGSGVTVTAFCPGPTATGFAETAQMNKSRLFNLMTPMPSMKAARIGYRGMLRGKRVVVPGVMNWIGAESVRFGPRILVAKIARLLQEGD